MLHTPMSFRKQICNMFLGGQVIRNNGTILNMITDKLTINFDMFSLIMKHRIISNFKC